MHASQLIARIFRRKTISTAADSEPQAPASNSDIVGPGLAPLSRTTTSNDALISPASNSRNTQAATTVLPNQKSPSPKPQQTWSGSPNPTVLPPRSSTIPSRPPTQASQANGSPSAPTSPATATNAFSSYPQAAAARTGTDDSIAHSHRPSRTWKIRSAASFRARAEEAQPKTGGCTEHYSVYCLEWEALRGWLLRTFDGYAFGETPNKKANVDHDLYVFTTPRPLNKKDKDEIYKLRWDYNPEGEVPD